MFQDRLTSAKQTVSKALSLTSAAVLKKYYTDLLVAQDASAQEAVPDRHAEEWKYVDFKFLKNAAWDLKTSHELNLVEVQKDKVVVTIQNTSVSSQWKVSGELPQGISFLSLEELVQKNKAVAEKVLTPWSASNYFSRLNESLNGRNGILFIDSRFASSSIIELHFVAPSAQAHSQFFNSQLIVVLGEMASATIVEHTLLNTQSFFNSGVDYYQAPGSQLKILKIEKGEASGWGCHTARYSLDRDAQLFSTTATIGPAWSRHNVFVELTAPGAQAEMLATYLAEGSQFVDHHTTIEHKSGHTTSLQKYTGVLAGKAKAVFNGRVKIDRHAQKSSAVQINRNLLLSKTAEVNTKPELQIDADDVQAKHGATVGQIQPDELFYLQSRGIPEAKARTMLTRGFIEEIGLLQPQNLRDIYFKEVGQFLDKVAEG